VNDRNFHRRFHDTLRPTDMLRKLSHIPAIFVDDRSTLIHAQQKIPTPSNWPWSQSPTARLYWRNYVLHEGPWNWVTSDTISWLTSIEAELLRFRILLHLQLHGTNDYDDCTTFRGTSLADMIDNLYRNRKQRRVVTRVAIYQKAKRAPSRLAWLITSVKWNNC